MAALSDLQAVLANVDRLRLAVTISPDLLADVPPFTLAPMLRPAIGGLSIDVLAKIRKFNYEQHARLEALGISLIRPGPRRRPVELPAELPAQHEEALHALATALGELCGDRLYDQMVAEMATGEGSAS